MGDNISVIIENLPYHVRGFTIYTDDHYTIYINAKLGYYAQRQVQEHELQHIRQGDFTDFITSVRYLESDARLSG